MNTENTEVKEIILGNFKPKRKFLNFISSPNGVRVRFIRDIAFIKGKKLSGTLEGLIFKITICDEGTIKFEEVDTTVTDEAQRKRLLDDIDSMDVTGYTQKYVIANLEFNDIDGNLCYLEVESKKPIDVLRSLVDEEDKPKLSDRGMSILDELFGTVDEEIVLSETDFNIFEKEIEASTPANEDLKSASKSYMEEQFQKINENKVKELVGRIDATKTEIQRSKMNISQLESTLKKSIDSLGVLETRLETMTPANDPNGFVFYISEEQKGEEELSDNDVKMIKRISKIASLKEDVLIKILKEGFYTIKIADKSNILECSAKKEDISKILDIDVVGSFTVKSSGEFEYRGDLNWHQLVSKMIRAGFEQDPKFDEACLSNSYKSKELMKELDLGKGFVAKTDGGFVDMGNGVYGVMDSPYDTPFPASDEDLIPEVNIPSTSIKEFVEETTLVILGTGYNDHDDVQLTDDYSNFGIIIGDKVDKSVNYESDGFISLLTIDEFKEWKIENDIDNDNHDLGIESLLVTFKGKIGVTAFHDGKFTNNFDINNYIQRELNNADVFITLPEGSVVTPMNRHNLPISILRDIKINKVIEKNVYNKDDDQVQEVLEEFEECNGYEMGDEFLFAFLEDKSSYADPDYPFAISINPKSYFDNDKCQYDQHVGEFLNLPEHFEEVEESSFVSVKSNIECISELIKMGFKFNVDYQNFMEANNSVYTINGQTLYQYIYSNYPNSII